MQELLHIFWKVGELIPQFGCWPDNHKEKSNVLLKYQILGEATTLAIYSDDNHKEISSVQELYVSCLFTIIYMYRSVIIFNGLRETELKN